MNKRPKICLFTAHSPAGGGGGAILRSLVPELDDQFEICWRYLATKPTPGYESGWLGTPIIGSGGFLSDAFRTATLLGGAQPEAWNGLIDELLSAQCDAYWIVSHNEGLCVARDLQRRTPRPVHLTVHDDWAGALCAGSRRYRAIAFLADRLTKNVLRGADSVDVVSNNMSRYYSTRVGVVPLVVHRWCPWQAMPPTFLKNGLIHVGHIGSIYSKHEFLVFVSALKLYAEERKKSIKVILWGSHLKPTDFPKHLAATIDLRPTQSESSVINELQQCEFVYAMYPFASRRATFVQTSFPTKLSSYVMAQRPIVAHSPPNSTLVSFLKSTKTGVCWTNTNVSEGKACIAAALGMKINKDLWKIAHNKFFGESNIQQMRAILRNITHKSFCSNPQ